MPPIFVKALPDIIAIDVMWTLCSIGRQIDCIHSQQVWVSDDQPQRNNQMTPIFMKALPNMIAIDVMWTLCIIDRHIDCIHSQQVWVSGYKPQWYNQIMPIFMKALPDMIVVEIWLSFVIWTLCSIDLRLIASTVSRYEFQVINHEGIIKWRLYLWESITRYDCHRCNVDLI